MLPAVVRKVPRAATGHDFHKFIAGIGPVARWKVFQVLGVDGENQGPGQTNGRNADDLFITTAQFDAFVDRHRDMECLVPEDNATMQHSYLILDERLRFLDTSKGAKVPSDPVPEVGVQAALRQSHGYDEEAFHRRKGVYEWERRTASSTVPDMEDFGVR